MLRNTSFHPGIRLTLALLVSAALHSAVFPLSGYFWKEKHPPPPKPGSWKFDMVVARQGEGLSHKPDAPALIQNATTQVSGENKLRAKSFLQGKKLRKTPAPKAEDVPVKLVEEPVVAKQTTAVQQPTDAQRQVEAMAGAMANLANMQFMMGQVNLFYTATRSQMQASIAAKFTEEMLRQHAGSTCTFKLYYVVPAIPADSKVDCGERQELADMLTTRLDWRVFPQPEKFFLSYRNMKITLWFEGYQVRIGLKADD